MQTDRGRRIEILFHASVDLKPAERAVYLAEACGDDEDLRREVSALIAADEDRSSLLESPPWLRLAREESTDDSDLEIEADLPFARLGDFRLIRKLGMGGMGVVYLARQESLGRMVALKLVRPERTGSFETTKRFWREVKAVGQLRHPNIVTVYGSGEQQGVRYFAMELVSGKGLDEVLREAYKNDERPALATVLEWGRAIALALARAHRAGIIHRDVKLSNIRIDLAGRAMLMDFGIARHQEFSTMTRTGEFRGTPQYASPEQVRARRSGIDARTDIFSLGVSLYEVLTGKVPFVGETTEQVFHQILNEEPVPPRRLNPSISRDLQTVLLTAMEKDLGRRYQTMKAFADDLERVIEGRVIAARPAGPFSKLWKRTRRYPIASAAIALAFFAIVALAVGVPWVVAVKEKEKRQAAEQASLVIAAKRGEAEKEALRFKAINAFLEEIFTAPDPWVSGKDVRVADMLAASVEKLESSFCDQPEIKSSIYECIGWSYRGLGLYARAEILLREALRLREMIPGGDHTPRYLRLTTCLGLGLEYQGRYQEAESLLGRAAEQQSADLGEEHPDLLRTQEILAGLFRKQDRLVEAEALARRVLRVRRDRLPDGHPDTLRSMNVLALVLLNKGEFAEAETLLHQAFEARREAFGHDHLDVLSSLNDLAGRRSRLWDGTPRLNRSCARRWQSLNVDSAIMIATPCFSCITWHPCSKPSVNTPKRKVSISEHWMEFGMSCPRGIHVGPPRSSTS